MLRSVDVDPLDNPFRPGAGTPPPALLGRDALIDSFGLAARRVLRRRPGKSLFLTGLRGVGKTVLLNRFAEIADDEGFHVAFIEAPERGDVRTLLAARLRRVLLTLDRTGASRTVFRALQMLKTFSLQLPDGSRLSLGVEPLVGQGDSGDLSTDLSDLLEAVGRACADCDTGLLLAIDELQYLDRDELGALIAAIHRSTQLDLPTLLVGAGLPQLPALAGEAKSYAERLFDFPSIGSLDADDARAALQIPAQMMGSSFDEAALTRIVAEAHGYPYFLQEWGYHVWDHAPGATISADDVDAAAPAVLEQLDRNFFRVRFDRLTPKERDYLRAMADLGAGPHRSGDVAARLGVRVESVAPRRSDLIGKGMIYSPAHGDTAFTVPLFDEFLRRTMPDWTA